MMIGGAEYWSFVGFLKVYRKFGEENDRISTEKLNG
jgi:hypothetical protein